jgi:hypothetical protein
LRPRRIQTVTNIAKSARAPIYTSRKIRRLPIETVSIGRNSATPSIRE